MLSRTSFFNRALFRKTMSRFWPLWALPSFIGALFPLAFLTHFLQEPTPFSIDPLDTTLFCYQLIDYGLPIVSLCYAILVAAAVWSYLFNNRSVGLMHTLPLRRETLFVTNFLAGMSMMLIPYVITGGLALIVVTCYGGFEPVGILVTALAVIGESLFYFAGATVIAFITGNLIALPVLYFIFHFLFVALDALVNAFASGFLFGVRGDYTGVVEPLSPTVYLMNQVRANATYEDIFVPVAAGSDHYAYDTLDGYGYYTSELVDVALEKGWVIAVYAALGIALLALAFALYRKRRSECAGDVVAVNWMKPVFRWGVTLCGALAGGLALYYLFWFSFQNGDYYDVLPLLVAMLLAGAIAYYAAGMLLTKSFRVFRGSWKGLGAALLVIAAICGVLRFDLFGVEKRVPAASNIEYLEFYAAGNNYTFFPDEDAELLEQVRAVHAAIAADENYILDMNENRHLYFPDGDDWRSISSRNTVRLTYHLKNGTQVARRYYVPIVRDRLTQPDTYDFALNALVGSESMKLRRIHADDGFVPTNLYIYADAGKPTDKNHGETEARLVLEAIARDAKNGTWGNVEWFGTKEDGGYQYAIARNFDFQRETVEHGQPYDSWDSIHINIYPEMKETVACLLALGLVDESNLKTYRELHPEEYPDELLIWDKVYADMNPNSFPDDSFSLIAGVADAPAASIGVIGGADGPTAVYVTGG